MEAVNMNIENLKKILESERLDTSKQYGLDKFPVHNIQTTKDFTQDINFARRMTYSCAFKSGHEAATNRLLPLLQKAVETITTLGEKHPDCFCMDREAISKEFLLSLNETTESVSDLTKMTEIKKEGL